MLNFKQLELSDKKCIDACLENNPYRASDFCFTNLYTWQSKFNTVFAIESKTLFIRFVAADRYTYYMMPIGSLPIVDAFAKIIQDAEANGNPFRMRAITTRMWDAIEKEMPAKFTYHCDRENDEYIYLSERLINLSGKKLQSKRNHINRFKNDNPSWEYFPLTTTADYIECASMMAQWEEKNENRLDDSSIYDFKATQIMLDNFDYLQLRGGGIRVNGQLVAFSIGEPLTKDSFVVHVEKAFGEMNGAYTIMNQQFIECEAADFTYINREEDMGFESLRKAKLSYQPDILLQEGIITLS